MKTDTSVGDTDNPSEVMDLEQQDVDFNILNFPDCILMQILQLLDVSSLYQLGNTCTRFAYLTRDESLWEHVNGRGQLNQEAKVTYCWKNVHKNTKSIFLAGDRRANVVISMETLFSSTLSNLTILALEHQYIKYCKLEEFPDTLQELSLKNSYIFSCNVFFSAADEATPNLRTLILDHCQCMEGNPLLSISKLPKLEILSLYMCKKIMDTFCIDSIKRGFKNLKVADLRFTVHDVSCFASFCLIPSIQILYSQCFPTTYYLERYQRKLEILSGAETYYPSYISDDEDNNNVSKKFVKKRCNASELHGYNALTIRDATIALFQNLEKINSTEERPKSFLYRYPYDECTCGFFNRTSRTYGFQDFEKGEEPQVKQPCFHNKENQDLSKRLYKNDKFNWDSKELQRKLNSEIEKHNRNLVYRQGGDLYWMFPASSGKCFIVEDDMCTNPGNTNVPTTPDNNLQDWLYLREPRNDYEIAMRENTNKYFRHKASYGCGKQCSCSKIKYDAHKYGNYNPPGEVVDTVITEFIKGVQKLRESKNLENDAKAVAGSFLKLLDKVLKTKDMCKLENDPRFMSHFCEQLQLLSSNLARDIERRIGYHAICFRKLLKQLYSNSDGKKGDIVNIFFTNLIHSESAGSVQQNSTKEKFVGKTPGFSGSALSAHLKCGSTKCSLINKNETKSGKVLKNIKKGIQEVAHDSDSDEENDEELIPWDDAERMKKEKETDRTMLESMNQLTAYKQNPTYIKEFSLRGYSHISDETLRILSDKSLQLLDVTGTNVTESGVRQFMAYNPQCRLIHKAACVCRPKLHF